MVTDEGPALLLALLRRARDSERAAGVVPGYAGLKKWADVVERLPEFEPAATAVAAAGGRRLDGGALVSTGIAGLITSEEDADLAAVADQLWHYATRATTAHWEAVALDVDELPDGIAIGGWSTWNPDAGDLAAFAPVPAAAHHLRHDPWPVGTVTQHALLRRHAGDSAGKGLHLVFRGRRFELVAVWPLGVLNLYSRHVVNGVALFDIWEHDYVTRWGDGVAGEYEPWDANDPDGDWRLRLYTGRLDVTDDTDHFRRFCEAVDGQRQLLADLHTAGRLMARLDRAIRHFILGNAYSDADGTAETDTQEDVILRYVICLEALLTPDNRQEVSRSVAQRAALLIAGHGTDAVGVHDVVKQAYNARSRHVHGGESTAIDLPSLRDVTRKVLLRWLVMATEHAKRAGTQSLGADRTRRDFEALLEAMVVDPARWKERVAKPWETFTKSIVG